MTIRRTDAARNASSVALNDSLGPSAQIHVRSGVNAGIGGQGVLLAQLTGDAASWGTAVNGVLTSSAITSDLSADATGIAGHYQRSTQAGVLIETGLLDISGTDGATIDNPSIVLGQIVQSSGPWIDTEAYDDGV